MAIEWGKNGMAVAETINDIVLKCSKYIFDFDLYTGSIERDILDNEGNNFSQNLGLKPPFHFNRMMVSLYSKGLIDLTDSQREESRLCTEYLQREYEEGSEMVEKTFYLPSSDSYHSIFFYLITDGTSSAPHVYACCRDVTRYEKKRKKSYEELYKSKTEIDDIIACAKVGIWHIYLFEGQQPRMEATDTMFELLGISPDTLSDEDLYRAWHSRVKKSSLPSVEASVNKMIEEGFSENTYCWIHPVMGERTVRCGGTCMKVEGKGLVLRGYHSDITEIANAETKYKQMLEEALEEVNKQKALLQEALDNYKEADYDRRRDFLTGLRNRQDLFEFLQDVLSGKRQQIDSMFLMDIDDFKKLNDHYGHLYGDECLKRIGEALNTYSESNDIYFYRYGGEEILGISFGTGKSASTIAGEILKLISSLGIKRDDTPVGVVTVSIGYTSDNSVYEKMIDKADTAMYQAKEQGKNNVVCYEK